MAAGGFTESLLGASDEVFDLECEICQKKGKQREAKHICENCKTYICESCKAIHSRIPDLRQHKISPAMIQNNCCLCLKEGNKIKADHFCKTCKSFICSVCMDAHGTFDALKHHIIVSGTSLLRRHDSSSSDDVSNKFSNLSTSEMSNCPTDSPFKSKKRNKTRKSTQKSSKREESVDGARSATTVSSTDTSAGPSTDTSVQRQTKPLADMKVQTSYKINISFKNDSCEPWITGCCFMPGGELVLCDSLNDKIKLLDRSLTLQDSIALQGFPWDVADLDGRNIAVTLPGINQVQLIQLSPTVQIGRTISVDMDCRGIAVVGGLIYVSGADDAQHDKVNVYDVKWNLKRRLDGAGLFGRPYYLAASHASDRVFVSDLDTDTVTCLSSDIKVLWRYKDDTLNGPGGLYVDSHDNIIVCNNETDSVDIITTEGKTYKTSTLLSFRDGIECPYCVTFRQGDQTLVVGCWCTDVIYVYKLS